MQQATSTAPGRYRITTTGQAPFVTFLDIDTAGLTREALEADLPGLLVDLCTAHAANHDRAGAWAGEASEDAEPWRDALLTPYTVGCGLDSPFVVDLQVLAHSVSPERLRADLPRLADVLRERHGLQQLEAQAGGGA